jgi:hypothetical protein
LVVGVCFATGPVVYAQQIDVENFGKNLKDKIKDKKPFKINGGINASAIFYQGNAGSGRDPFSYFLNGNLNLSLYGVSVPLSFSYTNAGFSYKYSFPRTPNRLSIHPKYKWITGHIGDVAMSFSPYTLNGVLFTGAGVDLQPKKKWKYSLMYGRLQKAVEYRPGNGNTLATYKRKGYGAKIQFDDGPLKAAFSLFRAQDEKNSLVVKPDSLQIYPQENTAISIEASIPLIKNLVWKTEYGVSVLTRDSRAPDFTDSTRVTGLIKWLGGKVSTNLYKAIKTDLNYTIGSSMLGIGFERVDPGYQTLGAYFFANDLQNITANFAQALFKGKVNLSGNIGLQEDDVDKKKSGSSKRTVMAFNVNFNPSARLTTTATYSNFQTFTNIKPQFQYINQLTPYDNLDTLNFRQLSQNANINVNYIVSTDKEKPQNINLNFSFQDSYDMQGEVITNSNASQFYNFAGSYNRTNVPKAMSLNGAFNITYNTIGLNEMLTLGPTIAINKQLFDKKVRTGTSVSYNTTIAKGVKMNEVISFRMNAAYVYKKKHNTNISLVGMNRKAAGRGKSYDYTATISYSYNF